MKDMASSSSSSSSSSLGAHQEQLEPSSLATTITLYPLYEGQFDEHGRPHGRGTLLYAPDDSRGRASYTGEFLNGLRHGLGCLLRHDGGSYVGNFHEDQFSGYGVMRWSTGMTYRGEWQNDYAHGHGALCFPASSMQYVGSWQQGKRHGQGRLTYGQDANEKRLSYEGEWREDLESGQGKLMYVNGDYYMGTWQSGMQHGRGVHVFSKRQQRFEGDWQAGKMHGHGRVVDRNGEVFECEWIRGKRHSEAKRTLPHGRIMYERWSNGRKVNNRPTRWEPQSLVVLCIETIAKEPSSSKKRQRVESLPEELQERIHKCKLPMD